VLLQDPLGIVERGLNVGNLCFGILDRLQIHRVLQLCRQPPDDRLAVMAAAGLEPLEPYEAGAFAEETTARRATLHLAVSPLKLSELGPRAC
jgi:hypothetical protein